MRSQINRHRSIQRSQLIYRYNTEFFFNRCYENLLWIILLALPILPLSNQHSHITMIGGSLIVFFWIFIIASFYFMNHLTIIKGSNQTGNRAILLNILESRYPELKINDSGQHIIRCTTPTGTLTWGKRLTIIFDNDRLFINKTTLGRYDIKSPFHSIFNTIAMRQIKKDFISAHRNNSVITSRYIKES